MKISIFKYVEYLLPKHGCVILPDFGAFILSKESALEIDGRLAPPSCTVIFNQDLKHDDGVLVSFIKEKEKISYEKALSEVKDSVKEIKSNLSIDKQFKIDNLGAFTLDKDNILSFTSNETIVDPYIYGLSDVTLNTLNKQVSLDTYNEEESGGGKVKYLVASAVAAAAALLFFILPSAEIADTKNNQQADFISTLSKVYNEEFNQESTEGNAISLNEAVVVEAENKVVINPIDTSAKGRRYYIIIGGQDSKTGADKFLKSIQETEFPQAQIVESDGRYRIYVADFSDKNDAENYLVSFRQQQPKYATAWLYSHNK